MESTGEGERLKVAVLGATGQLGARVVAHLRERGADVVEVSRGQGTDVHSGQGLDAAFDGVSTVVDCLNLETLSRRRAVDFFTTAARNVLAAAQRTGVSRIVCVTILNAREPEVHRWLGYYAGKAAQEQTCRAGPGHRRGLGTVVRTGRDPAVADPHRPVLRRARDALPAADRR